MLASSLRSLARNRETLSVLIKDCVATAAAVLVISAAVVGPERSRPDVFGHGLTIEAPEPRLVDHFGVDFVPPAVEAAEEAAPSSSPSFAVLNEPVAAERIFPPAAGSAAESARVETLVPTKTAKRPVTTAKRARFAKRFEAIARTETAFAAALRQAGANGYGERFAKPAGTETKLARVQRAERRAAKPSSETRIAAAPSKRITVAEQIRQNRAKMPSTLHLSDLVKSVELAAAAQQAALPEAPQRSS